jgi:Tyrosine phosphatase family
MEADGFMPATQSGPARPASRFSPLYAVFRGCVAGFVAAWTIEILYMFLGTNVHVVAAGEVYRCARLDPPDLKRVVRQYKIRTLFNLCGCSDPEPWYKQESLTTCQLDICQEDLGFSAGRLPSIYATRRLVEALDRCDYPILIHCHRGIDRTGLASTVALLLHSDVGLAEARQQLSLRFGHLAVGRPAQIDRFFDLYQEWLRAKNLTHSSAHFRQWAVYEYCPGECRSDIALLEPHNGPLHTGAGQPFGFRIRCTNTSVEPWVMQPGANAGVHMGWTLLNEKDEYLAEGRSGLFDAVVRPGDDVDLTVALPPLAAGRYHVQLDMIDEQHAWFYQTGDAEPLTVELEVQ